MNDAPDEAPPEGTREYTRGEYLRVFGVSDSTLDRRIKQGKLRKRTVGRRVFLWIPDDATPEESREDPYRALLEVNRRLVQEVQTMHEAIIRMEGDIAALRGAGDAQRVLPRGRPPQGETPPDATHEAPREATGGVSGFVARLFGRAK